MARGRTGRPAKRERGFHHHPTTRAFNGVHRDLAFSRLPNTMRTPFLSSLNFRHLRTPRMRKERVQVDRCMYGSFAAMWYVCCRHQITEPVAKPAIYNQSRHGNFLHLSAVDFQIPPVSAAPLSLPTNCHSAARWNFGPARKIAALMVSTEWD